jgi:hypothetical protein
MDFIPAAQQLSDKVLPHKTSGARHAHFGHGGISGWWLLVQARFYRFIILLYHYCSIFTSYQ